MTRQLNKGQIFTWTMYLMIVFTLCTFLLPALGWAKGNKNGTSIDLVQNSFIASGSQEITWSLKQDPSPELITLREGQSGSAKFVIKVNTEAEKRLQGEVELFVTDVADPEEVVKDAYISGTWLTFYSQAKEIITTVQINSETFVVPDVYNNPSNTFLYEFDYVVTEEEAYLIPNAAKIEIGFKVKNNDVKDNKEGLPYNYFVDTSFSMTDSQQQVEITSLRNKLDIAHTPGLRFETVSSDLATLVGEYETTEGRFDGLKEAKTFDILVDVYGEKASSSPYRIRSIASLVSAGEVNVVTPEEDYVSVFVYNNTPHLSNLKIDSEREVNWSLSQTGQPLTQRIKEGATGTANFTVTATRTTSGKIAYSGSVEVSIPENASGRAEIDQLQVILDNGQSQQVTIAEADKYIDRGSSKVYPFTFTGLGLAAGQAKGQVALKSGETDQTVYQEIYFRTETFPDITGQLAMPQRPSLTLTQVEVNEGNVDGELWPGTLKDKLAGSTVYNVDIKFTGEKAGEYTIAHTAALTGLGPDTKELTVEVYQEPVYNNIPHLSNLKVDSDREVSWSLSQIGQPLTQRIKEGATGTANFTVTATRTASGKAAYSGSVEVSIPENASGRAEIDQLQVILDNGQSQQVTIAEADKYIDRGSSKVYPFTFTGLGLAAGQAKGQVALKSGETDQTVYQEIYFRTETFPDITGQLAMPQRPSLTLTQVEVNEGNVDGELWPGTLKDKLDGSTVYNVDIEFAGEKVGFYTIAHTATLTGLGPDNESVTVEVYNNSSDNNNPGGNNPGGTDNHDGPPPTTTDDPTSKAPTTEPDPVDKKDGGVTPPPSESVTPPKVKITPERVPAGDPTITVKSIEELKAAYAILPEGRRLDLKYDSRTGIWKNSFLVPFGTEDGPYSIKIFTMNRQNLIRQYYYTITIDNSLPLIILNPIKNNDKLDLTAQVLFPAAKVTAQLGNKNFALAKEQDSDKWFVNWPIPSDLDAGTYTVTVTAVDTEGHSGKATFVLEVDKDTKAKEPSFAGINVAEEIAPEIRVEATEVEKGSLGISFTWGIPLAGVLTVGLLKRRRK